MWEGGCIHLLAACLLILTVPVVWGRGVRWMHGKLHGLAVLQPNTYTELRPGWGVSLLACICLRMLLYVAGAAINWNAAQQTVPTLLCHPPTHPTPHSPLSGVPGFSIGRLRTALLVAAGELGAGLARLTTLARVCGGCWPHRTAC